MSGLLLLLLRPSVYLRHVDLYLCVFVDSKVQNKRQYNFIYQAQQNKREQFRIMPIQFLQIHTYLCTKLLQGVLPKKQSQVGNFFGRSWSGKILTIPISSSVPGAIVTGHSMFLVLTFCLSTLMAKISLHSLCFMSNTVKKRLVCSLLFSKFHSRCLICL